MPCSIPARSAPRDLRTATLSLLLCAWTLPCLSLLAQAPPEAGAPALPGTGLWEGELEPAALAEENLEGIHRFLERRTTELRDLRGSEWPRDLASPEAYEASLEDSRRTFASLLGLDADIRADVPDLELVATTTRSAKIASTEHYDIWLVRWPVLDGLHGEGLLLSPKGRVRARVVALTDADGLPEAAAGLVEGNGSAPWAHELASRGALVLLPTLVSREASYSGNSLVERHTNQPHREWIHRQAYQLGRHLAGLEVQKILAAVDWFAAQPQESEPVPIAVAGYGEGGLLALYSAAVDPRIELALVSGYFGPREDLHAEPIYRNVWRLLLAHGDAELAALVAPRTLLVDPAEPPRVDGPPEPDPAPGRVGGAAPGAIPRHAPAEGLAELERARALAGPEIGAGLRWIEPEGESATATAGGPSAAAVAEFARALGLDEGGADAPLPRWPGERPFDPEPRQERQVREMEDFVQALMELSPFARAATFWEPMREAIAERPDLPPAEAWAEAVAPHRERFHEEFIGRLPAPSLPPNPRTRLVERGEGWDAYLVVLDVWPEVVSWGYLVLPAGITPGERRPTVVVQHGLGGSPRSALDPESKAYRAFGARLAERGFVVYAPYNPNALPDPILFRQIQRRANPVGASIFSVIIEQHRRVLEWLSDQDFVDPGRIGFYGLSYGGKTAVRVPPVLDGYALSICSGDFNQWVRKIVTPYATTRVAPGSQRFSSYMYTAEYEIMEFNQGNTFDYAEMAALVSPRPFMVERGHRDLVASDEWAAYEYATVRRHYADLGIPELTEIEYFDDGHVIHGEASFRFLHRHLEWPE